MDIRAIPVFRQLLRSVLLFNDERQKSKSGIDVRRNLCRLSSLQLQEASRLVCFLTPLSFLGVDHCIQFLAMRL